MPAPPFGPATIRPAMPTLIVQRVGADVAFARRLGDRRLEADEVRIVVVAVLVDDQRLAFRAGFAPAGNSRSGAASRRSYSQACCLAVTGVAGCRRRRTGAGAGRRRRWRCSRARRRRAGRCSRTATARRPTARHCDRPSKPSERDADSIAFIPAYCGLSIAAALALGDRAGAAWRRLPPSRATAASFGWLAGATSPRPAEGSGPRDAICEYARPGARARLLRRPPGGPRPRRRPLCARGVAAARRRDAIAGWPAGPMPRSPSRSSARSSAARSPTRDLGAHVRDGLCQLPPPGGRAARPARRRTSGCWSCSTGRRSPSRTSPCSSWRG